MSESRRFVAAKKDRSKTVDIELVWEDNEGAEHTTRWTAYPGRIPSIFTYDLVEASRTSEPMWRVFRAALQEKYDDFYAFCMDDEHGIDAKALSDIIEWLLEVDTGRPTQQLSS